MGEDRRYWEATGHLEHGVRTWEIMTHVRNWAMGNLGNISFQEHGLQGEQRKEHLGGGGHLRDGDESSQGRRREKHMASMLGSTKQNTHWRDCS